MNLMALSRRDCAVWYNVGERNEGPTGGGGRMIEMSVDSVRVSTMNSQRVVILKETHGDKSLPIWVGPAEADACTMLKPWNCS